MMLAWEKSENDGPITDVVPYAREDLELLTSWSR